MTRIDAFRTSRSLSGFFFSRDGDLTRGFENKPPYRDDRLPDSS